MVSLSVFRSNNMHPSFSCRRGSVVALFNLTFVRDIANELGANVTNNLVNAVRSGSLGELAVDPDSLNITQSGMWGTSSLFNPFTSKSTKTQN